MAKVLLVEDDNNLREIYEARLAAEGYEIIAAENGEEALSLAKQTKPDLIISDVMMPRISGFEMLDILRNTDALKNTKIIMLTALGQTDDRNRADNLGADKYLVKSQVTLEDIINAAHALLDGAAGTETDSSETTADEPAAPAQSPITPDQPTATQTNVKSDDSILDTATLPSDDALAVDTTPAAAIEPAGSEEADLAAQTAAVAAMLSTSDETTTTTPSNPSEITSDPLPSFETTSDTKEAAPSDISPENDHEAGTAALQAITEQLGQQPDNDETEPTVLPTPEEKTATTEPVSVESLKDASAVLSESPQSLAEERAELEAQIQEFETWVGDPLPPDSPQAKAHIGSTNDGVLEKAIQQLSMSDSGKLSNPAVIPGSSSPNTVINPINPTMAPPQAISTALADDNSDDEENEADESPATQEASPPTENVDDTVEQTAESPIPTPTPVSPPAPVLPVESETTEVSETNVEPEPTASPDVAEKEDTGVELPPVQVPDTDPAVTETDPSINPTPETENTPEDVIESDSPTPAPLLATPAGANPITSGDSETEKTLEFIEPEEVATDTPKPAMASNPDLRAAAEALAAATDERKTKLAPGTTISADSIVTPSPLTDSTTIPDETQPAIRTVTPSETLDDEPEIGDVKMPPGEQNPPAVIKQKSRIALTDPRKPQDPGEHYQQATVISPTNTNDAYQPDMPLESERPSNSEPASQVATNMTSSSVTGHKIIQPFTINDPSKPTLQELLAKEEAATGEKLINTDEPIDKPKSGIDPNSISL